LVTNDDLNNIIDNLYENLLHTIDDNFLHLFQLFHDLWFGSLNLLHDNILDILGEFAASILDLSPPVPPSVCRNSSRLSNIGIGDDFDNLVADGDNDSLSLSDDHLFDIIESTDYKWLVFIDDFLNLGF